MIWWYILGAYLVMTYFLARDFLIEELQDEGTITMKKWVKCILGAMLTSPLLFWIMLFAVEKPLLRKVFFLPPRKPGTAEWIKTRTVLGNIFLIKE